MVHFDLQVSAIIYRRVVIWSSQLRRNFRQSLIRWGSTSTVLPCWLPSCFFPSMLLCLLACLLPSFPVSLPPSLLSSLLPPYFLASFIPFSNCTRLNKLLPFFFPSLHHSFL